MRTQRSWERVGVVLLLGGALVVACSSESSSEDRDPTDEGQDEAGEDRDSTDSGGGASTDAGDDDAGGPQPSGCPSDAEWGSSAVEFEQEVLRLVNVERAKGGSCGGQSFAPSAALRLDGVLVCAARLHSQDMVEQDYFAHESLDGRSPFERIEDLGFEGFPSAENIASGQSTPGAVMGTWMKSAGHCANILASNATHLGVGYVRGGDYGHMWTQNFGVKR